MSVKFNEDTKVLSIRIPKNTIEMFDKKVAVLEKKAMEKAKIEFEGHYYHLKIDRSIIINNLIKDWCSKQ